MSVNFAMSSLEAGSVCFWDGDAVPRAARGGVLDRAVVGRGTCMRDDPGSRCLGRKWRPGDRGPRTQSEVLLFAGCMTQRSTRPLEPGFLN